ncbi:hypothetical protein [Aquimarina algicola]|uniref:Uncharacterized protein n=1 Tax=Aquimarina algicola TaxID=2589995 RepID=A0A504JEJ5_9FLAO|nr:hypothetical protein [Aquimarina algicola]TPN87092.1 hypothetical protein FHK87_05740 [Aquimarina algicola]
MGLPELAHAIRKELSVNEIKQAAKEFGLSHFYFTQKIKSIDTSRDDLLRAVECLLKVHNAKNDKIQELYTKFLKEYENKK